MEEILHEGKKMGSRLVQRYIEQPCLIDKKKLNLAVLYLVTVALKFTVYVIFFYPRLHSDGILERQEFFMFFVPYGLGLILEIMLLARSQN